MLASRMGVDFLGRWAASLGLGAPVKQLLLKGRSVRGVELANGEKISADETVLNADFGYAMTTLVPDRLRRRWTDATLARKRFSCFG